MYIRRLLFVYTWIQFAFSLEDLALRKTATMSTSQYTDKWLAGAAVDGNTDQTLEGNSCAVTSDDYKPEAWWKVDLVDISSIEEVKIYYRDENDGNSYTFRLSGFYIYVSNDSVSLGSSCYVNNNGNQANPGPSSITSFPCVATGRYVTIYKSKKESCQIPLINKSNCVQLELCEVKVLGAVDITTATTMRFPTSTVQDEYVGQQLGNSYTYRLSGFYIYVSNDSVSLGSFCYVNNNGNPTNPGPNSITSFPCVAIGRYVTIYKSKKGSCTASITNNNFCAQLELCEVEVLGYVYKDNCPKNCLNEICDSDHRCFDCENGYTGTFCNVLCEPGKFGRNCSQTCDSACQKGSCHYSTGKCATNCVPGRKGKYCDEACGYKEYGIDCLRTCGNCLDGGCSAETGICLNGCIDGWTGPSCSSPTGNQLIAVVVILGVGLAILIAINVLMIIKSGLFPCRRGNDNSKNQNRSGTYVQSTSHGTTETYENPNMSVISDSESSHTYTPLQIRGQLH